MQSYWSALQFAPTNLPVFYRGMPQASHGISKISDGNQSYRHKKISQRVKSPLIIPSLSSDHSPNSFKWSNLKLLSDHSLSTNHSLTFKKPECYSISNLDHKEPRMAPNDNFATIRFATNHSFHSKPECYSYITESCGFGWVLLGSSGWASMIQNYLNHGAAKELIKSGFIASFESPWSWIVDLDRYHFKGTHPLSLPGGVTSVSLTI